MMAENITIKKHVLRNMMKKRAVKPFGIKGLYCSFACLMKEWKIDNY